MGRAPCCDKANVKRGPWSPEEDSALKNYVETHGTGGNWIALPQKAGLKRCGKSCRLRWLNYLRPDIKHGGFTDEEDNIICSLYKNIGSRWSVIASQLQGRTDNDVKNYWNTKLKKKILTGKISLTGNNMNNTSASSSPSPAMLNVPSSTISTEGGSSKMFPNLYQIPVGYMGSLEFSVEANNHHIITSSPHVTSASVPPLDSSWWFGHGIEEDDRFLMDFGHGSSYDLLNGAAATNVAYCSGYDDFLSNTSDPKPHGLYQSLGN